MKVNRLLVIGLTAVLAGPAVGGPFGEEKSPDERRTEIRAERDAIIEKVIASQPEIKEKIAQAPGYGTFSTVNVNLLLLATARGSGVIVDNANNKETFMSVTSLGGGLGAGIKDMRVLLVFNNRSTFEEFATQGWQFAGQTDATLKSGDKGVAAGEAVSVAADAEGDGLDAAVTGGVGATTETEIEIYRITESGISLQATINGTKFSKIEELNE